MALEEMFETAIREGALFYGQSRRRQVVTLDTELRALTATIAAATRALLAAGRTPRIGYEEKRCDGCSLMEPCRPHITGAAPAAAAWLEQQLDA